MLSLFQKRVVRTKFDMCTFLFVKSEIVLISNYNTEVISQADPWDTYFWVADDNISLFKSFQWHAHKEDST